MRTASVRSSCIIDAQSEPVTLVENKTFERYLLSDVQTNAITASASS
jgi:hypothetical protein